MYDNGNGLKNAAKIAGQCILAILAMAVFVFVLRIAVEREEKRQEKVSQHRCQYYGAEINAHAGREICPPTVNG